MRKTSEDKDGLVLAPVTEQRSLSPEEIARGNWVRVRGGREGDEGDDEGWLGCVMRVGSNYVYVEGPADRTRSRRAERIHFDEIGSRVTPEPGWQAIVREQIAAATAESRRLLEEVRGVTARLGMGERRAIGGADAGLGSTALALGGGRDPKTYRKELERASKKTLPALFKEIEAANDRAASWMGAELLPLESEKGVLDSLQEEIGGRIFNVELYAGLCERLVEVRTGAPANNDERLSLMQRRCYMDEECLAAYEAGGMEYRNLKDFEAWLCRADNFRRIFPFPRTAVGFRVRRHDKRREAASLGDFIRMLFEEREDKKTFLYFRNGEQLWRLGTEIQFGEQLFPEAGRRVIDRGEIYARFFGGSIDEDHIISRDHYEDMVRQEAAEAAKALEDQERDGRRRYVSDDSKDYRPCSPDDVYYDDIMRAVARSAEAHNRLVLVIQGVLDRSPALHPHPPWRLWTPEGFEAGLRLVHDDSRALAPDGRPDFEAYRAERNASLKAGSVTVGQEEAWERHEARKENERDERRRSGGSYERERLRPYGDPGPGSLARIAEWRPRSKVAVYRWTREKYGRDVGVPRAIAVPASKLLNVDAYVPGDWKIFFADPRTRAEYLQWAPLLLEAEEYHAGNRKLGGYASKKRRR